MLPGINTKHTEKSQFPNLKYTSKISVGFALRYGQPVLEIQMKNSNRTLRNGRMKIANLTLFRVLPTLPPQCTRIPQRIILNFVLLHVSTPNEKELSKNENTTKVNFREKLQK